MATELPPDELEQARSNKGKLAAFRRFLTGEE